MTEIYTWIKDILLTIITLNFFQILIPDSSIAKYLRFIFSLIVLAVMVEPLVLLLDRFCILA